LAGVILPIVITLIAVTLVIFLLVSLYRVCHKKTPGIWLPFSEKGERNHRILDRRKKCQVQSDKEGVKLLSVKTTSAETGEWFFCVYV
ncbi:MUCEN protein, partial [Alectura lathami]|nr:MUCEN protein [Alectura lathami]